MVLAAAGNADAGTKYVNRSSTETITTNAGQPVPAANFSVSVGPRGPVLLEDFHLQEQLATFNRAKIPERVVHARGMTAKGHFEVTHDISKLSCANLFSEVGKRTPVAVRFSTVVHERGSPESLRDVRGFAIKFYTDEGNWDLVGNDIPVFFVRNGNQFVPLNWALKPNPVTGVQEGWRVLDFLSHHPESTHILTWLLDYNGIPANWRSLEGFGVNTFTLLDKAGKDTLVKFHWFPEGGAKFLTDDEAKQVGDQNMRHSHATADLVEAIKSGNPPVWNFAIQTMDPAKQEDYRFDPLDDTKTWPEDEFPLQQVGRIVLDTPISNIHNENEQIAFSPGVLVPGIGLSNDKLLISRVMAYSDAQRYRIGSNYLQLPINAPRCPFHPNQADGAMQFQQKDEEVNYYESEVEKAGEHSADNADTTITHERIEGYKTKEDLPKSKEPGYDFYQAGDRWRTVIKPDAARADAFLEHIIGWMSMPKCNEKIRNTWLGYWSEVDKELGQRVKSELDKALAA